MRSAMPIDAYQEQKFNAPSISHIITAISAEVFAVDDWLFSYSNKYINLCMKN